MAYVVKHALSRGLLRIDADYIPSAKNGMVKNFYQRFGFEQVFDDSGHTRWTLDPTTFQAKMNYIAERQ